MSKQELAEAYVTAKYERMIEGGLSQILQLQDDPKRARATKSKLRTALVEMRSAAAGYLGDVLYMSSVSTKGEYTMCLMAPHAVCRLRQCSHSRQTDGRK